MDGSKSGARGVRRQWERTRQSAELMAQAYQQVAPVAGVGSRVGGGIGVGVRAGLGPAPPSMTSASMVTRSVGGRGAVA